LVKQISGSGSIFRLKPFLKRQSATTIRAGGMRVTLEKADHLLVAADFSSKIHTIFGVEKTSIKFE